MKAVFTFILIFLTVAASFSLIESVKATEDSWATKALMPTERSFFGVAVVNGKIYTVGGSNAGVLNITEEYDPVTDIWKTKAAMPTPRSSFGIAVYDNKIYVIGGVVGNDVNGAVPTGANEVYDPETDTWATKTPMPVAKSCLVASVVDGKIYLISGLLRGLTQYGGFLFFLRRRMFTTLKLTLGSLWRLYRIRYSIMPQLLWARRYM
jgi:N-acetylneuraminic acid mutarotase